MATLISVNSLPARLTISAEQAIDSEHLQQFQRSYFLGGEEWESLSTPHSQTVSWLDSS